MMIRAIYTLGRLKKFNVNFQAKIAGEGRHQVKFRITSSGLPSLAIICSSKNAM
jgi:hypothetical protein